MLTPESPDPRTPASRRAGVFWLSWMIDLTVASAIALWLVESRDLLDIIGTVVLLAMGVSTVATRWHFGTTWRPRLRDGFHTVLILGCFGGAMLLRDSLGLEITVALASLSVAGAFAVAAAVAVFGPARWLDRSV